VPGLACPPMASIAATASAFWLVEATVPLSAPLPPMRALLAWTIAKQWETRFWEHDWNRYITTCGSILTCSSCSHSRDQPHCAKSTAKIPSDPIQCTKDAKWAKRQCKQTWGRYDTRRSRLGKFRDMITASPTPSIVQRTEINSKQRTLENYQMTRNRNRLTRRHRQDWRSAQNNIHSKTTFGDKRIHTKVYRHAQSNRAFSAAVRQTQRRHHSLVRNRRRRCRYHRSQRLSRRCGQRGGRSTRCRWAVRRWLRGRGVAGAESEMRNQQIAALGMLMPTTIERISGHCTEQDWLEWNDSTWMSIRWERYLAAQARSAKR
jgi:hypothetical protein